MKLARVFFCLSNRLIFISPFPALHHFPGSGSNDDSKLVQSPDLYRLQNRKSEVSDAETGSGDFLAIIPVPVLGPKSGCPSVQWFE